MSKLKLEKSSNLLNRAMNVTPQGIHSQARKPLMINDVSGIPVNFPKFFKKAKGSRIFDVDGNQYIDFLLAMGSAILGHGNQNVDEAAKKQINKGVMFGTNCEIEIKLSEKISKNIPCAEQIILTNSGTLADTLAVRIAKSYTKRKKILKFEGHFHGFLDWSFYDHWSPKMWRSAGISSFAKDENPILPWNNIEVVEKFLTEYGNDIAAVICEPIVYNCFSIMPEPGFLESIRKITREEGIVLIFDEVVTGWRLSLGGFQKKFNIVPDMATFAKAMANGYPIAAITGKKEIMESSFYYGGTFNSHPVCVAASLATINELEKPKTYDYIYKIGETIIQSVKDIIEDLRIEAIVQGLEPCFAIIFTELKKISNYQDSIQTSRIPHEKRNAIFFQEMIKRRIINIPQFGIRWHICASHNLDDAEKMITATEESLKEAKKIK